MNETHDDKITYAQFVTELAELEPGMSKKHPKNRSHWIATVRDWAEAADSEAQAGLPGALESLK